ncbi:MAG: M12 family metallo-peptidase [Phycisphaerae bacterium]|nr:M12 family metallo-peptidase [Phycisphaerae bacterium]MDW8261188.1 M12 family metallo-peptidase [Phycisphaerales bacterium]
MKRVVAPSYCISPRTRQVLMLALEPRTLLAGDWAPSTPHASDRVWTLLDEAPQLAAGQIAGVSASHVEVFQLNATRMRQKLATAGAEDLSRGLGLGDGAIEISIPTPEGKLARFRIVETQIMEPGLAAQFPQIRTYSGVGIDDPLARIALDFNTLGFHAQVRSPHGMYYVDPYIHLNPGIYGSYYRSDAKWRPENVFFEPELELPEHHDHDHDTPPAVAGDGGPEVDTGTQLRTYRLANAANGEYTQFFGGTVANAQSAIVTAINRVNQVYELDMTIRMVLIANNTSIIYTNPATDPYTNDFNAINQNQTNLDTVIGNANYDIGHVFTTGSGGIAGLGVVGITGQKARGTTGLSVPIGDPFYIDFVAHEMGHQFGANHTFNASDPARNASTAYEPGSGSTIMGYAGITGANNDLQSNSDAYFLFHSITEIVNRCDFTIPTVGTRTATGNSIPVVNAGGNFVIPANTPFMLTGSATDANGDPLTYTWEERDLGPAQNLAAPDNGSSPLFRSVVPSSSPSRSFPRLQTVLAGQLNTPAPFGGSSERIPTTNRLLNWTLTVRDNRPGGGASSSANALVQVVNTGSGFAITSFNSGTVQMPEGSVQTITWNVAGTTGSGINTANVRITMSTDNGNSFPIVLHASTPNDGSETFTVPSGLTNNARFKIEGVGNIFYDINNVPVQITPGGASSAQTGQPDLDAGSDTGVSSTDNITRRNNSSPANALTFNVPGTIAGALVQVYADGTLIGQATATGATTVVTTNGTTALADGLRNITARQTEPGKLQSPDSIGLGVTIDTVAPVANPFSGFNRLIGPHQLQISFNENVGPSLTGASLSLVNTPFGTSNGTPAVSYNTGTNTATFTFPGAPTGYGALANGNYTASLQTSAVTDVAGNTLVSSPSLSFFFVNGDANNDRSVELTDFAILSSNFNQSPRTVAQGDFNYSGGVDLQDFAILGSSFNFTLPPPAALPTLVPSSRSPFSSAPVDRTQPGDLLDGSVSDPA